MDGKEDWFWILGKEWNFEPWIKSVWILEKSLNLSQKKSMNPVICMYFSGKLDNLHNASDTCFCNTNKTCVMSCNITLVFTCTSLAYLTDTTFCVAAWSFSCFESSLLKDLEHLRNLLIMSFFFACVFLLGFDSLMASYRLGDLALLYQLFSRVKRGQDELCNAFNEYIKVKRRCRNFILPLNSCVVAL